MNLVGTLGGSFLGIMSGTIMAAFLQTFHQKGGERMPHHEKLLSIIVAWTSRGISIGSLILMAYSTCELHQTDLAAFCSGFTIVGLAFLSYQSPVITIQSDRAPPPAPSPPLPMNQVLSTQEANCTASQKMSIC